MIHVREQDPEKPEGETRIRCGLSVLPSGDRFFFEAEPGAWLAADCPGCNPGGRQQLGVPLSQLSGWPGRAGNAAFVDVARSWGYE